MSLRIISSICLCFLFTIPVLAQSTPPRKHRVSQYAEPPAQKEPVAVSYQVPASEAKNWFGIAIGPNFSSYTNTSGAHGTVEFVGGVIADVNLSDFFYLSTGLRYNSYGLHGSESGFDVSFNAHYLEIPVLFKPMIDAGGWNPYLLIGPNFGFKVGEGVAVEGNGISQTQSTSLMKTFDFSMDLGIGAEVPVAPNIRVFAQFEYALGCINVVKDDNAKTRGAMLLMGGAFGF